MQVKECSEILYVIFFFKLENFAVRTARALVTSGPSKCLRSRSFSTLQAPLSACVPVPSAHFSSSNNCLHQTEVA
jgi:hypothetical protein